jgi:hypothetical protein
MRNLGIVVLCAVLCGCARTTQAELDAADKFKCIDYGAQPGTDAYVACRSRLDAAHEAAEASTRAARNTLTLYRTSASEEAGMSVAKHTLEQLQELERLALAILCQAGALEECDYHRGMYFDGGGDVEEAYKLANAGISTNKIESCQDFTDTINAGISTNEIELPDDVSRQDFTDIIKGVYEFYCRDSCRLCNKDD